MGPVFLRLGHDNKPPNHRAADGPHVQSAEAMIDAHTPLAKPIRRSLRMSVTPATSRNAFTSCLMIPRTASSFFSASSRFARAVSRADTTLACSAFARVASCRSSSMASSPSLSAARASSRRAILSSTGRLRSTPTLSSRPVNVGVSFATTEAAKSPVMKSATVKAKSAARLFLSRRFLKYCPPIGTA